MLRALVLNSVALLLTVATSLDRCVVCLRRYLGPNQAVRSSGAAIQMVDRADAEVLKGLTDPLVIDVRDPDEVKAGKGGPPSSIPGSTNVPLNINGQKQSDRQTTPEEFQAKLKV
eukprot:6461383-Amphidinium_carterae.2